MRFISVFTVVLAALGACSTETYCSSSANYGFVCDIQNAEDIVQVPDTPWLIASSVAPGGTIHLIHSERKELTALYPADSPSHAHDRTRYGACPGEPDLGNFVTHGLHAKVDDTGRATLYAVSHGGREAIEVFDIRTTGPSPELTWIGCILMPDGLAANSVASFSDGSLVTTVFLYPNRTINDMILGEPTGAVYRWSPGDSGFTLIRGTELPGNNGIEVSPDESEFYVASSGLRTVVAYSATANPAQPLRTTEQMDFSPDNVHLTSNGLLVTAGPTSFELLCDWRQMLGIFDLEAFAACPRRLIAATIDPRTMDHTEVVSERRNSAFPFVTSALLVGQDIWLGTARGDRVAYISMGGA
jgi:hypothetical protein